MADNLDLDYDEVVIIKEANVAHGGSSYRDDLILTNKKLICISKGMFGGTKQIYHYPLDQIKVYNGIPQAKLGKHSNGFPSLDIYLLDGEEQFCFSTGGKKKIATWVEEFQKLFGVPPEVAHNNASVKDDSVLGAFKEVGENFIDIGRDLAGSLGTKLNKIKNRNDSNNIPVQANTPSKTGFPCPYCGRLLAIGTKFCISCGAPIDSHVITKKEQKKTCPSCGKVLSADLRFCTECGTEINPINDPLPDSPEENNIPPKENLTIDQQIELLQKLKSLLDAGIITPEEFEMKKKEIL